MSDTFSASRLDAWLDQTEASLDQQAAARRDPELITADLNTALASQPLRADSMLAVRRLFMLWLRAGDPAQALRVLDVDGSAAIDALPAEERADWVLNAAIWRVELMLAHSDLESAGAAFDDVLAQLASYPYALQYDGIWQHLYQKAAEAHAHALARRSDDARNALQRADPERAANRTGDDAQLALRHARSFAREGDHDAAAQAGARAIDLLAAAGADQEIDHEDWLLAGDALAPVMPEAIAGIVRQTRARIPAGSGAFALRGIEVRIARIEAHALHRQGMLEQAIDRLRMGRAVLHDDDEDHVSLTMLEWLLEAGRHEEAARLAFASTFHEGVSATAHALTIARRELGAGTGGQPWWQLALAVAGMAGDGAAVRGDEDEAVYVRRHLAQVRACADAHPAAGAVEGLLLIKSAGDYAGALPLLEAAVHDPSLANSDVVFKLWVARMRVHGVQAALAMPFVPASSAGSCYNVGIYLETRLGELLPEGVAAPQDAVRALGARYLEAALARFEAFVASGEGSPYDGDAHAYSHCCNNLAIDYRRIDADPATVLALHRKGIAASALTEHYQGIVNCHRDSRDHPALIDSAAQLWDFAADHSDDPHDPSGYVADVAAALHSQGRDSDIATWLQRLDQWWACVGPDEQAHCEADYLRALVGVLYYMAQTQPAPAMLRLDPILPSLPALGCPYTSMVAGHALQSTGQVKRALALYRDALRQLDAGAASGGAQRAAIVERIGECEDLGSAAKPWWKVW